jgi:hypothetical protein
MKIFSTLPAEVRKGLARKELRRRGLVIRPVDDGYRLWLPYLSRANLERLENLLISERPATSVEAMTPGGRAIAAEILGETLHAIDCAAVPDDSARAALRPLFAAFSAVP